MKIGTFWHSLNEYVKIVQVQSQADDTIWLTSDYLKIKETFQIQFKMENWFDFFNFVTKL